MVPEPSRIQAALSLVIFGLPWRHDAVRSLSVCSAACCHLPGEVSPSPQSTPPQVHLPVCLLLSMRTVGPGVVLRTDNQCLLFSPHNANPSELTASIQNECESQRPSALVLLGGRRAGRGVGDAEGERPPLPACRGSLTSEPWGESIPSHARREEAQPEQPIAGDLATPSSNG